MDILLVTLTIASVLVAAAMSIVAWRLKLEERLRADARLAALAAAIDAPIEDGTPWEAPSPDLREAASDVPVAVNVPGLFAPQASERAPVARLAPVLLAGAVVVLVATAAALTFGGGAGGAAAETSRDRPLELLSLRHAVKNGDLEITGLVRNPDTNPALDRVTSVVFLFDAQGGFLASGRAPLDFASLAPGEESPFVVSLAAPAGVARYRVSFRHDEGGLIPHVDQREAREP